MPLKDSSIRKFPSSINQKLKILWKDGKKLLNTKNANYSYGTLVDVLKHGIDTLPIDKIKSVLLLGMGGGSIIKSLREEYFNYSPVVAVEIDPVVIELAETEFHFTENEDISIHCMDAWKYIEKSKESFDLIIIDIFIDITVPQKFYKMEFWKMIVENVNPNGFILFNAGIDLEEKEVREWVSKLPDNFIYQKNYNVLGSNTVIILQRIF